MAKFRKMRARASRAFGKVRRSRSSSSSGYNPMKVVLAAAAYGAARGYISNAIKPLTDKVPLGNYADEVVFGTAGYFMAKKGKGIVKTAGQAILTVEAASLGSQVIGGMMQSNDSMGGYDTSY
jgi:hypothetical protein